MMEVPALAGPKKNTTGKPRAVPADVKKKQDPEYTPADFDAALAATTKRLDEPEKPTRGF